MKYILTLLLLIGTVSEARTAHQVLRMPSSGNIPRFGAIDISQSAAVTGTLPNARTTATDANTASTIVARDASGNFTAGTITAALSGNATTATTATNVTTNANMTGAVTSVGNATSLGSFSSSDLSGALTDESGSGAACFVNSPTLITPDLGTPSALVGTNITGTASGLTAGNVTTNANLTGDVTSVGNATTLSAATVTGKALTGYSIGTTVGTVAATDTILQAVQKIAGNQRIAEFDDGNSGTSDTIDFSNSPAHKSTLTGNCTFTFSNPIVGQAYILKTVGDGTVRTITWPASVKWAGGTAPTMTGTAGKFDLINFYYDGTNYLGSYTQNY